MDQDAELRASATTLLFHCWLYDLLLRLAGYGGTLMFHSLRPVVCAPRRLCAPSFLMASLLLAASDAHAGSYVWQTEDANGNVTAQSPVYSGGVFSTVPAAGAAYTYTEHYGLHTTSYGNGEGHGLHYATSTCSGDITVTYTWQHDPHFSDATDPPPASVVVEETSSAKGGGGSPDGGTPSGSCDNGLGVSSPMMTPYNGGFPYGADCTSMRYKVMTGGPTVTLTCTPKIQVTAEYAEIHVLYTPAIFPVFVNLNGTVKDSSGSDNILIGQGCTPSISAGPCTLSNFNWSPGGDVFDQFQMAPDQSWGHASFPSTDVYVTPTPTWRYLKDTGSGTLPVLCTATASINGQSIGTVTASRDLTVFAPYYYFNHNAGPTGIYGSDVSTGTQSLVPPGMSFVAAVGTPALFSNAGTGQWLFVQIINTNHRQWYPLSFLPTTSGSGGVALDNEWPYKSIWPADSTADISTPQKAEDSPDLLLNSNFNEFAIADTYQMYLMYVPPGNNSQYVPLHKLTWEWNASQVTENSNGSWPSGAAGNVTVDSDVRCYDHPFWQDKYVNAHN